MIHLGIRELSYHVRFDESCYYPIAEAKDEDIHFLFGLSYGFSTNNSLNVAWRPSQIFLDKIDLFAVLMYKGNLFLHYVHTIDTKQEYDLLMVTSPKHKFVGVEGYKMNEDKTAECVFKFSEHYFYPWFRAGLTYKGKSDPHILLERN